MREIKFRAWDKKCIEVYGTGMSYGEPEYFDDMLAFRFNHFESDNPSEIIYEQYTGLRDKNGKEIYEGDIIQDSTFKDRGSYIMAVEWEKEAASFVLTRNGWAFRHYFYESSNPDDCEVIGNIHENPELLK